VIAVPEARFSDWVKFSGGMSIKLACSLDSLSHWWNGLSRIARHPAPAAASAIGHRTQH
jgi:hypothetical protein